MSQFGAVGRIFSRGITGNVRGKKIYDILHKLEHSIDQENKPGGALPINPKNPMMFTAKVFIYTATGFTFPFWICYNGMTK